MYSPKKVIESLDAFEAREGWRPKYHTVDEVDAFGSAVKDMVTIESTANAAYVELKKNISKARATEIRQFIENEQVLCAVDYSYWESRYAFIQNEKGEIVRFQNRISQVILDSIIADCDERNQAAELLIIGSRQNGTSTKMILRCLHRALFSPYTQVSIASPDSFRSELARRVANSVIDNSPWWLIPFPIKKSKLSNGSVVDFNSGERSWSGYTPTCVYVDNVDQWKTPVKTFEEGLFRAVHSSARTIMVLHANMPQMDTWLRYVWNDAKVNWPLGRSRFCPIFIPWSVCSDIFPHKDWIKQRPIPEGWKPTKETREYIAKCEEFVRKTPYLQRAVGKGWKMSMEQMWFWEYQYRYATAAHTLESFMRQMPASDAQLAGLVLDTREEESAETEDDLNNVFPSASETQKKLKPKK